VVATGELVELKGPNRDRGKLMSFAIKGDLTFRILTQTETGDQALVVTAPGDSIAKVAYDLIKYIESEDMARANTREKE
jgi:hypothetical protein